MLLSVELKAAVLMAVFIHRLELIQALRSADRALPGHAASDASAQTFCALRSRVPFFANGLQP